jgi:hypothetical protein
MPDDDELFDQLGRLLGSRSGWHFEPPTTPGAPPSWCLDPGGEISLAVNVVGGSITVYLPDEDKELSLDGVAALIAWLDGNEARFLRS